MAIIGQVVIVEVVLLETDTWHGSVLQTAKVDNDNAGC